MRRWYGINRTGISISTGEVTNAMAFDGTNLWVGGGNLIEINPVTNATVNSYPTMNNVSGIAFDGARIWVARNGFDGLIVVDAGTGAVLTPVTLPSGSIPIKLAFDGQYIWVTTPGTSTVTRVDPSDSSFTSYAVNSASDIAFDGANIWAYSSNDQALIRIDAELNTTSYSAPLVRTMAFDGTNLWIGSNTNNGGGQLSALDINTGATVRSFPVGYAPYGLTFDGAYFWLFTADSNDVQWVQKVNPSTGAVVASLDTGRVNFCNAFCFDGAYVWAGVGFSIFKY